MTMTSRPAALPPDLERRIMCQLRTFPPGDGRTAAEIAGQMVGMDAQSMLGYLRTLAATGLVLFSDWPPDKATRWRLGL